MKPDEKTPDVPDREADQSAERKAFAGGACNLPCGENNHDTEENDAEN